MSLTVTPDFLLLTLFAAVLTYGTRVGGALMIAAFHTIPRRVAAALDAVPVAVMTALVAPAAASGRWGDTLAIAAAGLAALRLSLLPTLAVGVVVAYATRTFLGS